MNITLIGMPGAGKSTIGKALATELDYSFVDIDKLMEELQGMPTQMILNQLGGQRFLKYEERMILQLQPQNTVISPGGSIVYMERAMQHLKGLSTVVYIEVPLPTILERIKKNPQRGIVGGTVEEVFKERVPLYERYADVIVDGKGSVDSTVQLLLNFYKG